MNEIIRPESAVKVLGVDARAFNVVAADDGRILNSKILASRFFKEDGKDFRITAELRFDDELNNGHESFSVTGDIVTIVNGRAMGYCGGAIHEDIAKHFPEWAPLIKWHLMSTDGPMHYIANTMYLASDRDHNGRAAGEVSSLDYGLRFGDSPITHRIGKKFFDFIKARHVYGNGSDLAGKFVRSEFAHDRDPKTFGVKYSVHGFAEKWHECPFDDLTEANEFIEALNTRKVEFVTVPTAWSEGKARELAGARRAAIWPEATDEELSAPRDVLKAALEARLPKLLEDFKAAMLSAGFLWPERKVAVE